MRRLLSLALLCACGDAEPDPLDPDVIDDVAKADGDADGDARSGAYRVRATGDGACDCPEFMGVDLCVADFTRFGDGAVVTFTQYDGYLLLSPAADAGSLALTGSLDRDGAFDLAGRYDLSNVLVASAITTRMTGAFAGANRFAGVLRTHVRASSSTGTIETIDCRKEQDVTGERQTSP